MNKQAALKGVTSKPFTINLLALIHAFSPVLFIAYSFTVNDYRYLSLTHWSWLFDIQNTLFVLVSPFIAIAIFVSHLIGWILSLAYFGAVIISVSISVFTGAETAFTTWEYTIFITSSLVIVGSLLSRELRAPFFHPRLQWWKHDPRVKTALKAVIENSRQTIEGFTHDLSKSGLYLISEETVQQNEPFRLQLTLEENHTVEIEARIIWVNKGQKTDIPKGFGMRFVEVEKSVKKELKKLMKEKQQETGKP